MTSNDPMVQELERTARIGFRESGRGCIFAVHHLDGTSRITYESLRRLRDDPLPGISDDPTFIQAIDMYDTAKEYIAVEFIEEPNGTTLPTWYHLVYTSSTPTVSA
jgi:hypothetical protein